jgi:predicted RNase H-like HicB family nuclease
METTTFTVLAERAGRWWTIRIPQIDGLTAQARTLDQAEIMSRQVIARHLGVPPESISVDVIPDAPAPVAQALQARAVARQAVEAAAMATRAALEALAAEGHTFPDAATMLGLTPSETEVFGQAAGATLNGSSGPLPVTGQ